MHMNRIIGIVLLVAGIGLFIVGLNSSGSVADQVSETFVGRYTQTTTLYIVGGLVTGILGLLLATVGVRGKNS